MNKSTVQLKKELAEAERKSFEELCERYNPESPTYKFRSGQP